MVAEICRWCERRLGVAQLNGQPVCKECLEPGGPAFDEERARIDYMKKSAGGEPASPPTEGWEGSYEGDEGEGDEGEGEAGEVGGEGEGGGEGGE